MAIFRCPKCGGINRVPDERVAQHPKCGRCKDELDVSGHVQPIEGGKLRELVSSSPIPVLVDFWAPWCGPCRAAAPVVESVAHDAAGKMLVCKLNTDEDPTTSESLGIRGIPTFILFSGGKEIARQSGAMPREQLERWIRSHAG